MDKSRIATGDWKTFLTLRDENLLLVVRKHPYVVIFPILFLLILAVFFIGSAYFFFDRIFSSFSLFIVSSLIVISFSIGIIAKLIIDWYFHIYLLTNRKILEFRYTPLTSYVVNDVMLDRVYCTEIDFQTNGFVEDLIDLGDIIITFDRPTHQEEFIMKDIQACHEVGNFLTQQLLDGNPKNDSFNPIWFSGHSWGKR